MSIMLGVVMLVVVTLMLLWRCRVVEIATNTTTTTTTTLMMNEILQHLQNRPEGVFVVRGTSLTEQYKGGFLLWWGRRCE